VTRITLKITLILPGADLAFEADSLPIFGEVGGLGAVPTAESRGRVPGQRVWGREEGLKAFSLHNEAYHFSGRYCDGMFTV